MPRRLIKEEKVKVCGKNFLAKTFKDRLSDYPDNSYYAQYSFDFFADRGSDRPTAESKALVDEVGRWKDNQGRNAYRNFKKSGASDSDKSFNIGLFYSSDPDLAYFVVEYGVEELKSSGIRWASTHPHPKISEEAFVRIYSKLLQKYGFTRAAFRGCIYYSADLQSQKAPSGDINAFLERIAGKPNISAGLAYFSKLCGLSFRDLEMAAEAGKLSEREIRKLLSDRFASSLLQSVQKDSAAAADLVRKLKARVG